MHECSPPFPPSSNPKGAPFLAKDGTELDYDYVMGVIKKVVKRNARKYTFGIFNLEEITQQGIYFCLDAIPRYNSALPLENFLQVHLKNRYVNLKRDKFMRAEPQCWVCAGADHPRDGCCPDSGDYCQAFKAWYKRNSAKANLANPPAITDRIQDSAEDKRGKAKLEFTREELAIINEHLTVSQRGVWLRVRAGVQVCATARKDLITTLRRLLDVEKYTHPRRDDER